MQKYQNNVIARNGDAVVGIVVLITLGGTATPATIYSANGGSPTPNPLHTDANGYFEFYAADGRYDIYVGGKQAYTDVLIADSVVIADEVLAARDEVIPAAAQAVAARDEAVPAAATATEQAGIATTQAGVSTTKAGEAAASVVAANDAKDLAIDAAVDAQAAAGAGFFALKSAMDATSPQAAGTRAVVNRDPTIANNGYYTSDGAVFVLDTLQPASTASVLTLQGLVAPSNVSTADALTLTDDSGWIHSRIKVDGGLVTPAFSLLPSAVTEGFKVRDKSGWVIFDSRKAAATQAPNYWSGLRWLLFGDSITETGAPASGNFGTGVRPNWPVYAQTALEMADLKNYAVSGAAFRHQGQTSWQMIDYQISQAIANGETPDAVFISAGTNDAVTGVSSAFLGSYATAMGKSTLGALDLTLTAEAMRWAFWTVKTAWPNAKCFYSTPLQRSDFETSDKQPLMDLASQMAGRYGFIFIDSHRQSGIVKDFEPGRYLPDGLHPNPAGQELESDCKTSGVKNAFNY